MAKDIAEPPPPPPPAEGSNSAEPRKPRRRWARGADRPQYLQPQDLDRVMVMMVALMGEVSALRDRLDTHEAVADLGGVVTTQAVEAYELTPARREVREANRQAMLKRVLRAITEEREAALDTTEGGFDDHLAA